MFETFAKKKYVPVSVCAMQSICRFVGDENFVNCVDLSVAC